MEKGFNTQAFMDYLTRTFIGFENSFLHETVQNVIAFALKHEHVSKDQFCDFISDMLPEVTFGEVAMFTEDCCLTREGQIEKQKALAKMEEQ